MRIICKMKGGSHSYGLDTPQSDLDWRGVFLNTELPEVIGLNKQEHQQKQNAEVDEVYTEFRNALRLLRNANTQMIELLYADPKDFEVYSPEWTIVTVNKQFLVDSGKLFSSLRGYMQGELRLANGERTGKLGGKRKAAIDKYGFSPKNFVQLLRLAWAGSVYFQKGFFPVKIAYTNPELAAQLLDIKTNPQNYTRNDLNATANKFELNLIAAYENRQFTTYYNEDLAHELCLRIYGPVVAKLYEQHIKKL